MLFAMTPILIASAGIIFSLSSLAFFFLGTVYAQSPCEPIFNGGDTCVNTVENTTINKTIQDPQTNQFVEGFLRTDRPFTPRDSLTFQINLTNTGDTKINKIDVTDTLPQYLTFVKGPGEFDKDTKRVTFSVENLNADQSQSFLITAQVNNAENIPTALTCLANQVTAQISGRNQKAQDTVQFCINRTASTASSSQTTIQSATTKGGLVGLPAARLPDAQGKAGLPVAPPPSVKAIPNTGPQIVGLAALIPAAIAGYFLRRKANN